MREMDYVWHLRAKMAERGMFATTDLQPLLAERGDGRTVTPRGSASALPESFDGLGYSTL